MSVLAQPLAHYPAWFAAPVAGAPEALAFFSGLSGATMFDSGRVFGFNVSLLVPPTAGTLFLRPGLNGVPVGPQIPITVGSPIDLFLPVVSNQFAAGDVVNLFMAGDAAMLPAVAAFVVACFVFNRGIVVDDSR